MYVVLTASETLDQRLRSIDHYKVRLSLELTLRRHLVKNFRIHFPN